MMIVDIVKKELGSLVEVTENRSQRQMALSRQE